jgi:hypothetical protein
LKPLLLEFKKFSSMYVDFRSVWNNFTIKINDIEVNSTGLSDRYNKLYKLSDISSYIYLA